MQKEMTIHSALSYLKTASKRVEKALINDVYVTNAKIGADKINGIDAKNYRDDMRSSYHSVVDIIKTVDAIKKAISKANAELTVTVCGREMSVAEALYMMEYGIDTYKELLSTLRRQYAEATFAVKHFNEKELEDRADQFISSIYGNKDKANGADAIAAREDFKKKNSYEVVDPIGIAKEIKKLEDWISEFEADVDGAIQVSNATHTITIDV